MTRVDALDTLSGQQAALQAGKCSPRDLVERAIARACECRDLNGFITECFESARRAADGCAAAAGEAGSLRGIPFAHKDVFCTRGVRTTCASRMLEHFVPPYDATVAERLNQAQAILLGKANMDEFAMGSSNENSHFGPVRNPWDPTRVPGGSSGGSAALVAAGIVPFATGSDTGGSVRQPAAFCGITGLKPTYGRVSRHGLVAYASSLDQAGILAHTAQDCAIVLQVLAGHDPRDATSSTQAVQDYSAHLQAGVTGLRIGVVRGYFSAGVDSAVATAVHQALACLEAAGAKLVDVDLPTLRHAIPAYYVLAPAEASSNLARYDGVRYGHRAAGAANLDDLYGRSRAEGFGTEVKRRILIGTYVLSAGYYDAYYRHAQKVRRLIADDFAQAFTQVDLLAGPTAPSVAFMLGEKCNDPVSMYAADTNTVAVNLAGLPAISLPAGFVQSLPVGLQLVAPAFAESDLLRAGHALQQATDWHLARAGTPAAGSSA